MSIVFIKLPFNEKLFYNLEHNDTILNKTHHNIVQYDYQINVE